MKRILLFVAMIGLATPTLLAQQGQHTELSAADQKRAYASKVLEMEAALSRNHKEACQEVYQKTAALMHQHMGATKNAIEAATDDQKELLTKKLNTQNRIYGEAKVLSADILNKKDEMLAKLREFQETL